MTTTTVDSKRAYNKAYELSRRGTPTEVARKRRNGAAQRARGRAYARAIKLERGCVDCGYNAHPSALDFDHRPGTEKLFSIGTTMTRSIEAVAAEIAKCDVRCANCHRIVTHERRMTCDRD